MFPSLELKHDSESWRWLRHCWIIVPLPTLPCMALHSPFQKVPQKHSLGITSNLQGTGGKALDWSAQSEKAVGEHEIRSKTGVMIPRKVDLHLFCTSTPTKMFQNLCSLIFSALRPTRVLTHSHWQPKVSSRSSTGDLPLWERPKSRWVEEPG